MPKTAAKESFNYQTTTPYWAYKITADVKSIENKNRKYCFFDDIINLNDFDWWLLKIDKKSNKDIDIYYIEYIIIKKIYEYENISSVNPLNLIINSLTGHLKEKNDKKYLILDSTEKYQEVWYKIRSEIEALNGRIELLCKKNHVKIGINTVDDLPLNKPLKFLSVGIIIKCAFQECKKLYLQIYLDNYFYKL